MMNHIKEWKQLLQQHLGKWIRHRWLSVTLDIIVVDFGIKPAFLFDYGTVTATKMSELLSSAHASGFLRTELCVVCIEMDLLIVSPKTLHSEPFESLFEKLAIVDISGSLTQPNIVDDKELLKTTFEEFNKIKCFTGSIKSLKVSDNHEFNPSTLFGLLLGYPAVYWYDMNSDINCLSMQALLCYKVIGTLNQSSKEVNQMEHNMFSFSVPEQCQHHSLVQSWFDQIQNHTDWKMLFSDITLTKEMTTLPYVCL